MKILKPSDTYPLTASYAGDGNIKFVSDRTEGFDKSLDGYTFFTSTLFKSLVDISFNKNSMLGLTDSKNITDLIVEITSPSTATKDHIEKLALYEKHGVREYWIVQPVDKIIYVYELENAKYGKPDVYGGSGTMQCSIFQDLKINLGKVFDRASQKSFIEP